MTSIHEILSKPPGDFFLGVIELDHDVGLVGIIDDPVGVDLPAVRLAFPLEFKAQLIGNEQQASRAQIGFILPELGIPVERVIDAGSVDIHMGNSDVGRLYFGALRRFSDFPKLDYIPSIIKRPGQNLRGVPSGVREGS